MTKLFGSSGIRGVYGGKITPELMLSVGKAVGSYLKSVNPVSGSRNPDAGHLTSNKSILLARDTRLTSQILENAFASGIESTGLSVARAGIAPTPALAFAVRKLGMQTGAIITASHNPAEYNGIKLWQADSSAYTPDIEGKIEEIVNHVPKSISSQVPWKDIGQSGQIDIIKDYTKVITEAVEVKEKHKITLDCGHGAACAVSPELLSQFGAVSKIFSKPDGAFPGRKSEPCEENLGELKKLVVDSKAEVGFAHDGDADRI
ncbi:MAG: phosphoglucosamine mutase, partial [archaeon]